MWNYNSIADPDTNQTKDQSGDGSVIGSLSQ